MKRRGRNKKRTGNRRDAGTRSSCVSDYLAQVPFTKMGTGFPSL